MSYLVVIEQAADGSWSAYLPDVPGCVACGDSVEEVSAEIRVAVPLHLESLRAHGESLPAPHARAFVVRAA
jgi:predicted RNase H-like HicB family nuclease